MSYRYRPKQPDHPSTVFGWSAGGWFAITAIAFLLASAFQDATGRHHNQHAIDVPKGVVQINSRDYILTKASQENKAAKPEAICKTKDGPSSVSSETILEEFEDAVYVSCFSGQTWNDPRPLSGNYADAMEDVVLSPFFLAGGGTLFVLAMIFPLQARRQWKTWEVEEAEYEAEIAAEKAEAAKAKAEKERLKNITAEDKRRELRIGYTRGEITDKEFEKGLERIYGVVGFPENDDAPEA